jgi:hypothetical protein
VLLAGPQEFRLQPRLCLQLHVSPCAQFRHSSSYFTLPAEQPRSFSPPRYFLYSSTDFSPITYGTLNILIQIFDILLVADIYGSKVLHHV